MRVRRPRSPPKILQPEVSGVGRVRGGRFCPHSRGQAGGLAAAGVGPSPPTEARDLCSLLATEPSVEEKLQKLHSEIKFALKVDNPVRPSWGPWRLRPLSQAVPHF